MPNNPYTLVFGKEPTQTISRAAQMAEIIEDFNSDTPSLQAVMIAGVRGSGKTVFMAETAKKICESKDWIVIELNSTRDMLTSLASKLSSERALAEIFKRSKLSVTTLGISFEISGEPPVTDVETVLIRMLERIQKNKKKVLITIDEVAHTKEMREFASAYQIFLSKGHPVFLLATGVYENIDKLQNDKVLTFLYRMPRIDLIPLNIGSIAENYEATIGIPKEESRKIAKVTRGYSFAFQVMGYYAFLEGDFTENAISKSKAHLQDYSYRKIWEDLSDKDRKFLHAIASSKAGKLSEIREIMNAKENSLNQYKTRMERRRLIDTSAHGYYKFALPFFKEFVLDNYIDPDQDF